MNRKSGMTLITILKFLLCVGKQIMECLENGVSKLPKLEGRFPQVSGISFSFDESKTPGQRVDKNSVKIGDEFICTGANSNDFGSSTYRMVTKAYLAQGKDGYPCLLDGNVLIDDENGPLLRFAVQNHFEAVKMRNGKTRNVSVHHQSLITLSRR
jgi:5'-nucleotidase